VAWGGHRTDRTRGSVGQCRFARKRANGCSSPAAGRHGAVSLLRSPVVEHARHFEMPTLLAVGAFVGFGSALTGTGGPILLIPILLLMRTPVRMAVALAWLSR
jgi:hypothetical protein